MARLTISSEAGSELTSLLSADDIVPGSVPSYELCKTILLYHPLGQKMAEAPVRMAQSKPRRISIPEGPEDFLLEAFEREWKAIGADKHIRNTMKLARTYGIASCVMGARGVAPGKAIAPKDYGKHDLFFNIADPLNTAGSLVLNQDPNSPDFQKPASIAVAGTPYHRSRAVVVMNEEPVYISYTPSAFGFVGRSVFQRALFPLKSFVQTMVANDMVSAKLGLLIAKMKQPGSIADAMMQKMLGIKRADLKQGVTGNVLGVGPEDSIETLNMMNVDGAGKFARDNIIADIATAADMPAVLLKNESFVSGFGEGTEDSKAVAQYVNALQEEMNPLYDFFDRIVMRRAWSEEFYATVQAKYPEYKKIGYENAFFAWANSFHAEWPSYLEEAPSEQVKTEEVKHRTLISVAEVMLNGCDPENAATVKKWVADNVNANKLMFQTPLELDWDSLATYEPPAPPGLGGADGEGGEDGGDDASTHADLHCQNLATK